jgi:hypothetical protein
MTSDGNNGSNGDNEDDVSNSSKGTGEEVKKVTIYSMKLN